MALTVLFFSAQPWQPRNSLSVTHQTRFGHYLGAVLFFSSSSASATANAALSPLSLHVALSLVAAGAGGDTRDQLVAALGNGGEGTPEDLQALAKKKIDGLLKSLGFTQKKADSLRIDEVMKIQAEATIPERSAEIRKVMIQDSSNVHAKKVLG